MLNAPAWIWPSDCPYDRDVYAEFYDTFVSTEPVTLTISADSNYAVYLNGEYIVSGQFPDFPYHKVFDTVTLQPDPNRDAQHLAVIVWHYGEANMSYFPGKHSLWYTVTAGEKHLCSSGTHVLSRISRTYRSGRGKIITGQLGFSFHYDASLQDGWMTGTLDGFAPSTVVEQELNLYLRPVNRCVVGEPLASTLIRREDNRWLFDLGAEQVGYLYLAVTSEAKQTLTISYGEHITDGDVRRFIGTRDFSVEVTVPMGATVYMNPFRRIGARYLSLEATSPLSVSCLTLSPVNYPLNLMQKPAGLSPLQHHIYDVAVDTLRLCMHDHYEDSPWREQALYAMDSRNQIICGYYAFDEFAFARASLALMALDERPDGLLSICTPSGNDLTIPSFSLHYFTEILEYTRYSGDLTLLESVYHKLECLICVFIERMQDDLIPIFTNPCHWNFYEWSDGLSGSLGYAEAEPRYDAALNCLFALALQTMATLSDMLGIEHQYDVVKLRVVRAIRHTFLHASTGLVRNSTADERASELVNALAILSGAVNHQEAAVIADKLVSGDNGMTGVTLSMMCFKYDALLKVDPSKYRNWILNDIDMRYSRMLDAGATSFWETEKGEVDFDNAGSLCHGWSSMPVYYYHLFFGDRYKNIDPWYA